MIYCATENQKAVVCIVVAVLIMLLIAHLAVTRAFISIILGTKLASQQLIDMPFAGMLRIINDRKGLRLLLL